MWQATLLVNGGVVFEPKLPEIHPEGAKTYRNPSFARIAIARPKSLSLIGR